jgi:hypothetical protein
MLVVCDSTVLLIEVASAYKLDILFVLVVTLLFTSVIESETEALISSPISNTAPAATVTGTILVSKVVLLAEL